jgi:putative CocE/NonD family hydrolase
MDEELRQSSELVAHLVQDVLGELEPLESSEVDEGDFVFVDASMLGVEEGNVVFSEAKRSVSWAGAMLLNSMSKLLDFPGVSPLVMTREATLVTSEGIMLKMTHFFLRGTEDTTGPVVFMRTPYYRRMFLSICSRFAVEGYHVVLQQCRKRFTGTDLKEFPIEGEDRDGFETLQWIEKQSFCNGKIGMFGPSYLGLVQFSLIPLVQKHGFSALKAIVPLNTTTNIFSLIFPGGSLHFDLLIIWLYIMLRIQISSISSLKKLRRVAGTSSKVSQAFSSLPLRSLDERIFRTKVSFVQEVFLHNSDASDPFWNSGRLSGKLCSISDCPPISFLSGWYDCFFRAALQDIEDLTTSHSCYRLIVGPWTHWDLSQFSTGIEEALSFFKVHLKGQDEGLSPRVRVFVMGLEKWVALDSFPSSKTFVKSVFFSESLSLSDEIAEFDVQWKEYSYDPSHPTPAVGGASFNLQNCGKLRQNSFERRKDVLVFTSSPLKEDLCVLGPIKAQLFVWSSSATADFVVRLCDVYPDGSSFILCDGLTNIKKGFSLEEIEIDRDGKKCRLQPCFLSVDVSATGNLFKKGHRIRVHVASAAHPRWYRNLNVPEGVHPFDASLEHLSSSSQLLFMGSKFPSCVFLSMIQLDDLEIS